MGLSIKKLGKKVKKTFSPKKIGIKGLPALKKELTTNMPFKEAVEGAVPAVGRIRRNINKRGFKAFTMGQLSGTDRAREIERRKTEAALAAGGPKIDDADKAVTELPTMDMAEVQEAKRRKLLEFMSRSGRRSTILSDKGY